MKLSQHKTCTGCAAVMNPSVYPFTLECELEFELTITDYEGIPKQPCYKPSNNEECLKARNLVFESEEYDEDELTCMVNDCAARESKLSDWECSFISTCGEFVDQHIMLSKKQRDILTEIWERVT